MLIKHRERQIGTQDRRIMAQPLSGYNPNEKCGTRDADRINSEKRETQNPS